MNKKIMIISIAAFLLFCVFLILAADYYTTEIPAVEQDIDYYLAKDSFNQQEGDNVGNYLFKLETDDFKNEKNQQLAKKYLVMVKEDISKYQDTMNLAKKYLASIGEIKPGSDDNAIALQYFMPILNNKPLEVQGSFSMSEAGIIQTALISTTTANIQLIMLRQDVKGMKITSLGEIQIDHDGMTMKLGGNVELSEIFDTKSYRLKNRAPSEPFYIDDQQFYGKEFTVTRLENGGKRIHITNAAENKFTFDGKNIDCLSTASNSELTLTKGANNEITSIIAKNQRLTAQDQDLVLYSENGGKLELSKKDYGYAIALDNTEYQASDIPTHVVYHNRRIYDDLPNSVGNIIIADRDLSEQEKQSAGAVIDKDRIVTINSLLNYKNDEFKSDILKLSKDWEVSFRQDDVTHAEVKVEGVASIAGMVDYKKEQEAKDRTYLHQQDLVLIESGIRARLDAQGVSVPRGFDLNRITERMDANTPFDLLVTLKREDGTSTEVKLTRSDNELHVIDYGAQRMFSIQDFDRESLINYMTQRGFPRPFHREQIQRQPQ